VQVFSSPLNPNASRFPSPTHETREVSVSCQITQVHANASVSIVEAIYVCTVICPGLHFMNRYLYEEALFSVFSIIQFYTSSLPLFQNHLHLLLPFFVACVCVLCGRSVLFNIPLPLFRHLY